MIQGSIRVGQKGKFLRLPYPVCSCGKTATVSKSENGSTKHSCVDCYATASIGGARKGATVTLLRQLGLLS